MLYYIVGHVTVFSVPAEKISSPKSTNVYDVAISVLSSRKLQNLKMYTTSDAAGGGGVCVWGGGGGEGGGGVCVCVWRRHMDIPLLLFNKNVLRDAISRVVFSILNECNFQL